MYMYNEYIHKWTPQPKNIQFYWYKIVVKKYKKSTQRCPETDTIGNVFAKNIYLLLIYIY